MKAQFENAARRSWRHGSVRGLRAVLLAATVLAGPMFAGDVAAQSLEDALATTYNSNPELLAARAALRATDEDVSIAKGGWRPSVSASFSSGYTINDSESRGVSTADDDSFPQSASVSVTQPLYTGGAVDAAVDEADANVQGSRADMFTTEQSVLLEAVTAYVDVIQAESTLELQINNVQRLEKQLQATRDRFRVGEVTRTDVAQAESRLARARADRTTAEGTLVEARVEFERVVGVVPNDLSQPAVASNLPASREQAVEMALGGSFSLVAAQFDEAAQKAAVEGALADLYPTLDLVGQYAYSQDTSGVDNRQSQFTAELQLTVPLYQQGIVYAGVRQEKELLNQARLTVDQTRRSVVDSAASTFETYQTSLAQIESLRAEVASSEVALDGVQQEATVGARTVLDVLDAEQELLDAQVSLVAATRDSIVASYQLLVAMGHLTAQDLALPVEIYDYDKHYRDVEGKFFGTDPVGRLPGD